MKVQTILFVISASILSACSSDNSSDQNNTAPASPVYNETALPGNSAIVNPLDTTNQVAPVNISSQPNPAAPANAPLQATTTASGSVKHYICPNNCQGSGGDQQVNCPVCKTQYVHNEKFHQQPGQTPTATPQATQVQTQPAQAAAPATNSKGVYHYICNKGCAGGSGIMENCAKCGNQLAHNQSYHDDGSK
ncbi:MAG TPA: hypothetical protein PKH65_00570 [Bacteroidia bacterium]|nr:hypothetical protein [Bacteroidia bacterium]HNT79145.1 hypothetical protein [Bacteroidia bacterium]